MKVVIRPDGNVVMLYDDTLVPIMEAIGKPTVTRASHVEPCCGDPSRWSADMQPSGGPVLGPFGSRAEALRAEVAWLEQHCFEADQQS